MGEFSKQSWQPLRTIPPQKLGASISGAQPSDPVQRGRFGLTILPVLLLIVFWTLVVALLGCMIPGHDGGSEVLAVAACLGYAPIRRFKMRLHTV